MNASPRVSVVMAVYNAEAFLAEALESVLFQSFRDLELVVIDDGSTDATAAILGGFRDRRVQVLTNPQNLGFAASLNRGIDVARGSYIARLDADDICGRDRLQRQVAFLDDHQDVAILGSAARVVGEGAAGQAIWTLPQSSLAVRFAALLRSPFLHPTVMLRRAAFKPSELVYDAGFAPAEDYELWSRALRSVEGANLPEPLVTYRLHDEQMTSTRRSGMLNAHDSIARSVIARELPHYRVAADQITNVRRAFVGGGDGHYDRSTAVRSYLHLLEAFAAAHTGDPDMRGLKRDAIVDATRVLRRATRDATFYATVRDIIRIEPTFPLFAIKRGLERMSRRQRAGDVG